MLEQASVEGEAFLHKQRVKEYNSFKEEIRKPKHPHERYGRLSGTLSSARAARELSGIPNWIQHAIDVSGADSTHDSPHIPAIQTVALEIADWAAKFIQYTELYVSPEATHSWDLTWLQNLLAPPIKYHIHCKHVIQIVDDLSQQIRDLGGYESLHSEDKAIVDLLAPVREASESIEIKNSWGSEPISREVAGQASARRAKEEQIRLLALTLLKNRPGELRYIEDPERAWKMAMQMAKEAIEHPRRPLG
jgi:hypothetical protein